MDEPICTKFGVLIPRVYEENKGRSELGTSVLSSISGNGDSCSTETKQDGRTALRPKWFFWRDKKNKKQNLDKPSCIRFPVKVSSLAPKISTIEKSVKDKVPYIEDRIAETAVTTTKKLPWTRLPVKMVSVARELSTAEKGRRDQSCLFRQGYYRNKCQIIEETVLGSSPDKSFSILKK
jgi:hypothetical protein